MEIIFRFGLAHFVSFLAEKAKLNRFWVNTPCRPLKQTCHDCHFKCVVCELSKHTRSSYLPRINHAPTAFQIIHFDIWGPSPVTAVSGHRYYVTFIDDYTRTWVYLLKKKSEVFTTFTYFLQMIIIQYNTTVCHLRSDNCREYV